MKKLAQIIFFLTISWGLIGFMFAIHQDQIRQQANYQIAQINNGHTGDLSKLCRKMVTSGGFLATEPTRNALKARATCEYQLFSMEK